MLRLPSHYPPFKLLALNPFDDGIDMNPGINFFDKERL